eukprot:TRINITY_DN2_c0_g3_i2.p1 TRINITY_DN2_c0_g3~~TRINITY_DN2_c0_g3_i2.p1  ORF type:complete len:537 (+),score=149.34 TRINITY_DN2_c0_g3_i2:168-1778(+)
MVNKKALIIASTAVAVLIAAAVVVAVMFTVGPASGNEEPSEMIAAVPNPGPKRVESNGNMTKDSWVLTYKEGVDLASVKADIEAANMPWQVLDTDQDNLAMNMICAEKDLGALLNMRSVQSGAKYVEAEQEWRADQAVPWGVDRTDQRNLPLSGTYATGGINGAGVEVHVLDTGVVEHRDLAGRVKPGYDAVKDGSATTTDCQGHGTHVAGTIAGTTYGIAKGATIYASRVLGCSGSGSTQGIKAAIDYVANLPATRKRVINMSLGGGASTLLDQAVANAHNKGVTVVVAAGNENQDACNVSPARAGPAITVGASDSQDRKASFSNYGTCVDVIAPGVNIISTSNTQPNGGTKTLSGTSMASPHVAGVAALVLQQNPSFTPTQVTNWITSNATPSKITGFSTSTPNKLLWFGSTSGTNPNPNPTPTSAPTPTPSPGTTVTGSLREGQATTFPQSGYYRSTGPGEHRGTLTGIAGTDMDLYLYRYVNGRWAIAAQSATAKSTEIVTYNSVDNGVQYYIWQVVCYSNAGTFTLNYVSP